MFIEAKLKLWFWFKGKSGISEGAVLSWWAVAVWAILFPIEYLRRMVVIDPAYDIYTGTWDLHGAKYTDEALRALSESCGEVFIVSRHGSAVTLKKLYTWHTNNVDFRGKEGLRT